MLLSVDIIWGALAVFISGAGLFTVWISKLLSSNKDVVILQQMVKYLEERVHDLEEDIKELKSKRRG